jgi:late competence protein required for DNA uptake (superfamily II DNA/RNA helicase)
MKKTPHPATGLASATNAEPGVININTPAALTGVSLSHEQLLQLGTIYAGLEMDRLFNQGGVAVAVQAGIVATLHAILTPKQFRDVMIQWEVDAIKLSELLHLAGASATPGNNETQIIEA